MLCPVTMMVLMTVSWQALCQETGSKNVALKVHEIKANGTMIGTEETLKVRVAGAVVKMARLLLV